MTNYEKNKEIIDLMLQRGEHIALNKNTKEIVPCIKLDCEDCLFSRRYNWPYDCTLNRTKWLVEEYTKAEVDWSKVPIDTPVLVRYGNRWLKRHFAGVDDNGQPTAWDLGVTSWSEQNALRITCTNMKLAEVK